MVKRAAREGGGRTHDPENREEKEKKEGRKGGREGEQREKTGEEKLIQGGNVYGECKTSFGL